MVVEPARRRFTVEDYYRMAEAGILTEDDRVELIEGEIIQLSPVGSGTRTVRPGRQLAPLAFPDRPLPVADILGPS